jgi:hypothetical protein
MDMPGRVFFLNCQRLPKDLSQASLNRRSPQPHEPAAARDPSQRRYKRQVESPLCNHSEREVAPLCSSRVAPLACIGIGQLRRIRTPGKRSADLTWIVMRRRPAMA